VSQEGESQFNQEYRLTLKSMEPEEETCPIVSFKIRHQRSSSGRQDHCPRVAGRSASDTSPNSASSTAERLWNRGVYMFLEIHSAGRWTSG
jgi:hypothetical protein